MNNYEINGNLVKEKDLNYEIFSHVVHDVMMFFKSVFGKKIMNSIDLYIDNSTGGGGYTPITTPILQKYVIIKLHIHKESKRSIIAFQLSHELMHYVFFVTKGLDKELADEKEESICTAVSLVVIKNLYADEFEEYNEYVKALSEDGYRNGVELAEHINYDMQQIKNMI